MSVAQLDLGDVQQVSIGNTGASIAPTVVALAANRSGSRVFLYSTNTNVQPARFGMHVRDIAGGTTREIARRDDGTATAFQAFPPSRHQADDLMSATGETTAFSHYDPGLDSDYSGPWSGSTSAYVYRWSVDDVQLVSAQANGVPATDGEVIALSKNGRYVAFRSTDPDLTSQEPAGTTSYYATYVKDLQTGALELLRSPSLPDIQTAPTQWRSQIDVIAMSDDADIVIFWKIVGPSTTDKRRVWMWERSTDRVWLVHQEPFNAVPEVGDMTPDGRWLALDTDVQLDPSMDPTATTDGYVIDLSGIRMGQAAVPKIISLDSTNNPNALCTPVNLACHRSNGSVTLSDSGSRVSFLSVLPLDRAVEPASAGFSNRAFVREFAGGLLRSTGYPDFTSVSGAVIAGDGGAVFLNAGSQAWRRSLEAPDSLAPVVSGVPVRAANGAGWFREPVMIAWSAVDPAPSSGAATVPAATLADVEGEAVLYTSEPSCDPVGNCATGSVSVSLDRTAPVLGLVGPVDGSSVREDQYVAPTCSASDGLSGLDGVCQVVVDQTGQSPGRIQYTATASVADRAGNTAERSVSYSVITDAQAPVISVSPDREPNANGWYGGPVTYSFSCTDDSGVALCPGSVTISANGAGQSFVVTATDVVGNDSELSVGGINIDATAPVIVFSGNQGTYTPDQMISIGCEATDPLSGIDSASCPQLSGRVDDLLGLGANTLTATATDRAGNTTTVTTTITVQVTPGSLEALIRLYLPAGQPGNNGVANALISKVRAGEWGAFINQVNAQCCSPAPGKRLSATQRDHLVAYATQLQS